MAYFSNGAEGDYYEEKYCRRCEHYGETGEACPILLLHMNWNYEACNGDKPDATPETKAKYIALNTLWPRDGAHNGRCAMFIVMGTILKDKLILLDAFRDLARGIIEADRCNFLDDVSAKVELLAETAVELLEASKAKPNESRSLKNAEKNR